MKTFQERFWAKVNKDGACWLWLASKNAKGYGQISAGKRGEKPRLAHRASWEMHCGPIPAGKYVLHRCDTPACVNPDHLFIGTDEDNKADMMQKDRICRAERHPCAKLTKAIVIEIRRRYANGETQAELGRAFNISAKNVHHVVVGNTWKKELTEA